MRTINLNAVKAGITRLRDKAGASPESLFDLVNGYPTAAGTIRSRQGSACETNELAGTKGLVVFRDKMVVFADHVVELSNPDYRVEVLRHPDPDGGATLDDIRYAQPFLGYLYVVARWSDGTVKHYWLQEGIAWQANHVYQIGEVVIPTEPNGFAYRATRLDAPAPAWEPNKAREVGDRREPTTANGYVYTVIDTVGANPRSGATEPTWNTGAGSITNEDADNPPPPAPPPGSGGGGGGGDDLPPGTRDRYNPRGGTFETQIQ